MANSKKSPTAQSEVKSFLRDVGKLVDVPTSTDHAALVVEEYPFDLQLLSLSKLYRCSRSHYLAAGGSFSARVSSMMRALSAQDLFKDDIQFTPSYSELLWFEGHVHEVSDPYAEMASLIQFNEVAIFHEQNHRTIWRLLPPPPEPSDDRDLSRYLNFAESLVVILDLALGDQIGAKLSPIFERMNVIYRPAGKQKIDSTQEGFYRQYLLALFCTTYFTLEFIHHEDVLTAVNFVMPDQAKINKAAVKRGLEINELFTRVTNPLWQERFAEDAFVKLKKIHAADKRSPLYLPEDPLDIAESFHFVKSTLNHFGL